MVFLLKPPERVPPALDALIWPSIGSVHFFFFGKLLHVEPNKLNLLADLDSNQRLMHLKEPFCAFNCVLIRRRPSDNAKRISADINGLANLNCLG